MFEKSEFVWQDVKALKSKECPELDDDIIASFLTTFPMDFGDETLEVGTQKPTRKGKALYLSDKIQHCQFTSDSEIILFRATMSASMSVGTFRFPQVAIVKSSGTVKITMCTCEQKNGGRCCHVASLL